MLPSYSVIRQHTKQLLGPELCMNRSENGIIIRGRDRMKLHENVHGAKFRESLTLYSCTALNSYGKLWAKHAILEIFGVDFGSSPGYLLR